MTPKVKLIPTTLADCFFIEPKVYKDNRGVFFESFNKELLEKELNIPLDFVQDNHSVSAKGVLRGLHFQTGNKAQAKLIRVVKGEVIDVVVDLRKGSPTYLKHFKTILTAESCNMLFIPKGMAHGFLQDDTIFLYKCDSYYDLEAESGILYNDPDLNIDWEFPANEIILSKKDQELPRLKDIKI
ncbi:dTDP-4-dehydrorhamnose 3,5-epimerase [uncultured Muriicola sp.]|uniref:dTDP-4-dehydrorhamnose 3,5-epimerase n=1 Tax=uncultured Muriicola sp. TaxID=1583102 RepID=UPI00260B6737|nr:dTDP-4-dehydrorhamnose 3,5-epimerase [uncultured Muriicola sp.]